MYGERATGQAPDGTVARSGSCAWCVTGRGDATQRARARAARSRYDVRASHREARALSVGRGQDLRRRRAEVARGVVVGRVRLRALRRDGEVSRWPLGL